MKEAKIFTIKVSSTDFESNFEVNEYLSVVLDEYKETHRDVKLSDRLVSDPDLQIIEVSE